jgi:hypothetical protein
MHEINDLEYCVCNVMEDAVIEEESMKEIDIRSAKIKFEERRISGLIK